MKKSKEKCHKIPKNRRNEDLDILFLEMEIYIELYICSQNSKFAGRTLSIYIIIVRLIKYSLSFESIFFFFSEFRLFSQKFKEIESKKNQ